MQQRRESGKESEKRKVNGELYKVVNLSHEYNISLVSDVTEGT